MKRRTWILSALGAAGGLIIGWGALPQRSRLGKPEMMSLGKGDVALNGWIKIAADGSVVMAMPRAEMGQGIHTALPMLVAEELDIALTQVRIEQAGADSIYGNVSMMLADVSGHPMASEGPDGMPYTVRLKRHLMGKVARELGINATGGSSSVADAWGPVRLAAATARASLLGAAAAQWKLPLADLQIQNGRVTHASGKSASLAELASAAASHSPDEVTLKPRASWKLLGTSAARVDVSAKVNGTAQYGLDVRLPGMLYASVRQCPMLGGGLAPVDAKQVEGKPGVEQLVMLPSLAGSTAGVAVVARSWWQAQQAVQGLKVDWTTPASGKLDTKIIAEALETVARRGGGKTFFSAGNVTQAESFSATTVESFYSAPYLAHATMEPMNCTARVADGKVEIWAPTQVPQLARAAAAKVAGVELAQVTLHQTLLGGGFGRRLEVDSVAQAVCIAMATQGKPVQLIWSREEDIQHDFYRPMNVALLRAGFDKNKSVISLRIQSAGQAIAPHFMNRHFSVMSDSDSPDKATAEGLCDIPYGFGNQKMSHNESPMGVPVGFWRSVGHSHNAFFSECFVDEMAEASGLDPLAFRREWLAEAPRHLKVLNLAASKAKWGEPLPAGRARGMALHQSFGSIVAQVAEVSVEKGVPRVHHVVCAMDCGTVVNPGVVAQQVESSVVFALTAALYGKIDIEGGEVQQSTFTNYPLLQLAQTPHVQTYLLDSERDPTGAGEPAVPPLAPAGTNAVVALTVKRHRSLPPQTGI